MPLLKRRLPDVAAVTREILRKGIALTITIKPVQVKAKWSILSAA